MKVRTGRVTEGRGKELTSQPLTVTNTHTHTYTYRLKSIHDQTDWGECQSSGTNVLTLNNGQRPPAQVSCVPRRFRSKQPLEHSWKMT